MSIQEQFQRLIKGGLMICVATVLMVGLISCSSSSSDTSDSATTDLSGTVSTDAGTTTGRIVDGILLETVTNPLVGATVCVGDLISLECGDITAITDDTGSFTLSDVPNDDLDGTAYVSSVLTETDVDTAVETTTEISSYITEGQTEIDANILTNTSVQTQIAAVFDSGTGDTMGQVEGFGDDSEIDYFDVFGEMQDIIYNDEDYPPFMDYTMDTICPTDETCSDDMGLDQTQTLMVIKAKANFEAYVTQQGLEGDTTFTDLVVGFQEDLGDMYSEAVSEFPDGYETTMIFSDEWGTTDQASYSTYEVAMPADIEMADFPENMVWHEGTDLDTNYDNFVFADGATFVGDFDMPTDAIPGDGCVFGVGFQIPIDSIFEDYIGEGGMPNATYMDDSVFDELEANGMGINHIKFGQGTKFEGDFEIDDDFKTMLENSFIQFTTDMVEHFETFTEDDMANMDSSMTEDEYNSLDEGIMPENWDYEEYEDEYVEEYPDSADTSSYVSYSLGDSFKDFLPIGLSIDEDSTYYYVESQGIAAHDMMTGITGWNQRLPLPQEFTGDNAFIFPINPTMSTSTINVYVHGAIGVAVNGVPIFVPFKQNLCNDGYSDLVDGECKLTKDTSSTDYDIYDTYEAGELDECGGHSGRGDDYHYHTYSTCLAETLDSTDQPWAYAYDGFAIFSPVALSYEDSFTINPKDDYNGHHYNGVYHYHANDTEDDGRPYVIGGIVGNVSTYTEDTDVGTMELITNGGDTQSPRKPNSDNYEACFEDEPVKDESGITLTYDGTEWYILSTDTAAVVTYGDSTKSVKSLKYRYYDDTDGTQLFDFYYYSDIDAGGTLYTVCDDVDTLSDALSDTSTDTTSTTLTETTYVINQVKKQGYIKWVERDKAVAADANELGSRPVSPDSSSWTDDVKEEWTNEASWNLIQNSDDSYSLQTADAASPNYYINATPYEGSPSDLLGDTGLVDGYITHVVDITNTASDELKYKFSISDANVIFPDDPDATDSFAVFYTENSTNYYMCVLDDDGGREGIFFATYNEYDSDYCIFTLTAFDSNTESLFD